MHRCTVQSLKLAQLAATCEAKKPWKGDTMEKTILMALHTHTNTNTHTHISINMCIIYTYTHTSI